MVDNINRGPWHAMIDRQALAHQAQFGGTYEQAFVKMYTDPRNSTIVEQLKLDHLAKGHDAICGTRLSMTPVAKAAPAYDPLRNGSCRVYGS
jgi:hypothetical protein